MDAYFGVTTPALLGRHIPPDGRIVRLWCVTGEGQADAYESFDLLDTPCCHPAFFCSTGPGDWLPHCHTVGAEFAGEQDLQAARACMSNTLLRKLACDSEVESELSNVSWVRMRISLAIQMGQGEKAELGTLNHESLRYYRDRRVREHSNDWVKFEPELPGGARAPPCPHGAMALMLAKMLFWIRSTEEIAEHARRVAQGAGFSWLVRGAVGVLRFAATYPWHALLRSGWPLFSLARQMLQHGVCRACNHCCWNCPTGFMALFLAQEYLQKRMAVLLSQDIAYGEFGHGQAYNRIQLEVLTDLVGTEVDEATAFGA